MNSKLVQIQRIRIFEYFHSKVAIKKTKKHSSLLFTLKKNPKVVPQDPLFTVIDFLSIYPCQIVHLLMAHCLPSATTRTRLSFLGQEQFLERICAGVAANSRGNLTMKQSVETISKRA